MSDVEEIAKMFGARTARRHERTTLCDLPLLDALLPFLEYTSEQLSRGGFLDEQLTAAIKAASAMSKASQLLKPFGIEYEDLKELLNKRMKEQLKAQRAKRLKKR